MRVILVIGVVIGALFLAGRHYHWGWTDPATYLHHGSPTVVNGDAGVGDALTPEQAAQAAGRRTTVCGTAANVYYAGNSNGRPTFVDFGAPHPNEEFTIVIFGDDRGRFHPSPESWAGRNLCVTGLVKLYDGRPEIVAYDPSQIRLPPD